jgi:hypothetical protein
MTPEPETRPEPSREPPVAQRVRRIPRVRLRLREPAPEAPTWTRRDAEVWGVSLLIHGLFLLLLGLWIFRPPVNEDRTIRGRTLGTELGELGGEDLAGSLGLDEPLILPQSPPLDLPSFQPLTAPVTFEPDPALVAPAERSAPPAATARRGEGNGFGTARFGDGSELIQGVEVQVGDPQFTLIWQGRADLDLHVEEPGGAEISWKERKGPKGGRLDVDMRTGPGPENVYWEQGQGPPGVYRWYVNYYGPEPFQRFAGPISWRVRVKHAGQVTEYQGTLRRVDERSRIYELKIER